jgi:regulator of sigma E protease
MLEQTLLTKTLFNLITNLIQRIIPTLAAVVGFGLVIFIHELGHFVFCRAFNVTVPSFSIGFGPIIVKKKLGNTTFQISAIPVGGYNEIKDMVTQDAQGNAVPTADSFAAKPYWQRLIILTGGIGFNLILAVFLFTAISLFGPAQQTIKEFKILKVLEASPADKAGLKEGLLIVGIQEKIFVADTSYEFANFSQTLQQNLGKTIKLAVKQPEQKTFWVDVTLNSPDIAKKTGAIGIELEAIPNPTATTIPAPGLIQSLKNGLNATFGCVMGTLSALKQIVVRRSLDLVGGPVMILSQSFKQAKQGLLPLIFFLAYISVSLAVLNFLPIGALDGGRIMVESVEALIGKPILFLRAATNFGTLLLIILFIVLTYKDLYRLVFR